MDLTSLISLIFNAIFVSAFGFWLRYRIQNRKLTIEETEDQAVRRRSDLDAALAFVTQQRDDLREEVNRCLKRISRLEKEVQGQRIRQDFADPFPSWILSLDSRFLDVNRPFEKLFLEPDGRDYRDAIGEIPEGVWPEPFCRTVRHLSDLANGVPDGRARATTALVIGHEEQQVTVQKFTARIRGAIVAHVGYITNIEKPGELVL